jgi:hypothetical protein
MRFVPSFNDFNTGVSSPMPARAAKAPSPDAGGASVRASARPHSGAVVVDVDAARVDLGEAESAAASKAPRSPAMIFAESLYENMRQT